MENARVDLGIGTVQNLSQTVETLSGGQRQAVAVSRVAAFGSKVIILDEVDQALGPVRLPDMAAGASSVDESS